MRAIDYLVKILDYLKTTLDFLLRNPLGICASVFTTIITVIYSAVSDPEGAVNTFMIKLIDLIAVGLPSTPSEYQLGSMINSFYSAIPNQIGTGVISEIMAGIFGMLTIYLSFKVYKSLPFT